MSYKEALTYAMNLCSRQERCRSEVTGKLVSRGLSGTEIEAVLNALVKENYIDESRYAGSFVRDKIRFNKWGKVKIRYLLQQKKLPEPLIADALDAVDEEWYESILKEELLKKYRSIKGGKASDLRGKLYRFALQRGFESGRIYLILDEILNS
jgi:regulatory protein